jgi:hypothetical protein
MKDGCEKAVYLLVLALFVVSCAKELQSIAPTTLSVTSTDSRLPTKTLTNTPFVISAVTKIPSKRSPTATKTATITPDPVLLTQEAAVSSCASKERTWYTKHISTTYYVNGQWAVTVCSDNGIYTRVTNESLNIIWEIPAVYSGSNTSELSWYWEPFLWSPDGRYLYMKPVCLCFIDSPWLIYASGFGLSRLDLISGQLSVWLTPSDNSWYTFAFSSNVKLFAFTPPDFYQIIKIRDLLTGEERNISFKEKYNILEYRWTPDNSKLVIFTEEYVSDPSENGFSVFVYSFKNDAIIKLVDKNNLNFTFPTEDYIEPRMAISDLTDDILFLSDIFNENNFQFNIRSGKLFRVTELMTPTVIP